MISNATFFTFQIFIIGRFFCCKIPVKHITKLLSYRLTFCLHPFIRIMDFIDEYDFIFSIRKIGSNIITYFVDTVIPFHIDFVTFIIYFTDIGNWKADSQISGRYRTRL